MRFAIIAAIISAITIPLDAAAQSTCRRCDDCEGEYHKNVDTYFSVVGNIDVAHDCSQGSCELWFGVGVHQPVYSCQSSFAAYREASDGRMNAEQARDLEALYPTHVRSADGLLLVYDCAGDHVVGAFAIARAAPGPQSMLQGLSAVMANNE